MTRKVIPFLAAIAAAFAVTGFAHLASLPTGVIYALIGFVGGVLVCLGIPFAFRVSAFRVAPLKGGHQVQPNEAAVIAKQAGRGIAASYDETRILTHRLEQDRVGSLRPLVVTTGRTVRVSAQLEKSPAKIVKVGHLGHLTPDSAARTGHA